MCLCKFGENPPTGSEDRMQTRSYTDADTNANADADAEADGVRTKINMFASYSVGGT